MITKIAHNNFYEIYVDEHKNRMYLKIEGYWKTPEMVPNYVNDVTKANEYLKPGFTLLADLSKMKTPPLTLNPIHKKAQEVLVNGGLDKTAEVFTDIVLKTVTRTIAQQSNMKKQVFANRVEAEQWLQA